MGRPRLTIGTSGSGGPCFGGRCLRLQRVAALGQGDEREVPVRSPADAAVRAGLRAAEDAGIGQFDQGFVRRGGRHAVLSGGGLDGEDGIGREPGSR